MENFRPVTEKDLENLPLECWLDLGDGCAFRRIIFEFYEGFYIVKDFSLRNKKEVFSGVSCLDKDIVLSSLKIKETKKAYYFWQVTTSEGNIVRLNYALTEDGLYPDGNKFILFGIWDKLTNKQKISEAIYL